MKRIFLFILTNLALMFVLSIVLTIVRIFVPGLDDSLFGSALAFALVFGMGGAIISLLMSKTIARWTTRARVIDGTEGETEAWLISTVDQLARQAGIGMPQVAVYPGAANAFATGAFRNKALVAVSVGLIQNMPRRELRAVIGHEIGHIANGDMITMTLLQGVLNAAVLLLARVIGITVDRYLGNRRGLGFGYYLTYIAMQLLLGILASIIVMAYSRRREFAADRAAAQLTGSTNDMIAALQRLGGLVPGEMPESMRAFGINGKQRAASLFASHPPIETRIEALRKLSGTAL